MRDVLFVASYSLPHRAERKRHAVNQMWFGVSAIALAFAHLYLFIITEACCGCLAGSMNVLVLALCLVASNDDFFSLLLPIAFKCNRVSVTFAKLKATDRMSEREHDHYENRIDNNGATDDDMNIFPFTSFFFCSVYRLEPFFSLFILILYVLFNLITSALTIHSNRVPVQQTHSNETRLRDRSFAITETSHFKVP